MIILEGAEGVGKSTLAVTIAEKLDLTIHKFTTIPKNESELWDQITISKELVSKPVVQDRCPLVSDYIYSEFNANRNPYIDKNKLISYLKDLNALLIYVDNNDRNPTKSNFDTKVQNEIYKKYTYLFIDIVDSNIPCTYYNYSSVYHEIFMEKLEKIKDNIKCNIN